MNTTKSEKLYEQALDFMPGGVNSPVRAWKSVGKSPVFIDHAEGDKIYDVDGNEYIDYVCSWTYSPRSYKCCNRYLQKGFNLWCVS